jgi:hypothetical protein
VETTRHKLLVRILQVLITFAWLTGWLTLLGCAVPVVQQVPVPEVQPLPTGAAANTLSLRRVIIEVPKGTVVGERRIGPECRGAEPLKWDAGVLVYNEGYYHTTFDALLAQYNFRSRKNQVSLFDDAPALPQGELLVGAKITNIKQSDCMSEGFFSLGPEMHRGSARFSVRWEVYSPKEQKVVLVLENEGSGILDTFKSDREDSYFVHAFAASLKGLLKNEEFRKLVTTPAVKK